MSAQHKQLHNFYVIKIQPQILPLCLAATPCF